MVLAGNDTRYLLIENDDAKLIMVPHINGVRLGTNDAGAWIEHLQHIARAHVRRSRHLDLSGRDDLPHDHWRSIDVHGVVAQPFE
jgi:hypothetical protein